MRIGRVGKGLIAGGLGLALLIGGGTFALWSDSATVDAGTINSGTLDITVTDSSWTDGDGDPIDPVADYLIVPGDVLTLTANLTTDIQGDNLTADLGVDLSGLTSTDTDLLGIITDNSVLTVADSLDTPLTGTNNTFPVTPSTDSSLTATLTITFPSSTENQVAQTESVDLSALTFTLEQTA